MARLSGVGMFVAAVSPWVFLSKHAGDQTGQAVRMGGTLAALRFVVRIADEVMKISGRVQDWFTTSTKVAAGLGKVCSSWGGFCQV